MMMEHSRISAFALTVLTFLLILPRASSALDIAALLAPYPDLSAFAGLLSSTSVAADLSTRSSLTLLAVPNSALLRSSSGSDPSPYDLADVVRYHVLLQYLSPLDLRQIPPKGELVTTLFQTTGRAATNLGAVNLTRDPATGTVVVRSPDPFSSANATILSLVKTLPYNLSIYTVNSVLIPSGLDLTASENRPPPGVNITQVLIEGRDFNVAAAMLAASGVADEFEADERGAGITVFMPNDEAFAEMPKTGERLQSLTADQKAVVLRFHVLHSYYPLGSLESIVNPVQPTLATEDTGAGRFTLNITRVNGSVAIGTGIVQASITRTVFDQNPVAVFAVSRVLLPREIFGREGAAEGDEGGGRAAGNVVAASPPETGVAAPVMSPEKDPGEAAMLNSPSGDKGVVASAAGGDCIGFLYLVAVALLLLVSIF